MPLAPHRNIFKEKSMNQRQLPSTCWSHYTFWGFLAETW